MRKIGTYGLIVLVANSAYLAAFAQASIFCWLQLKLTGTKSNRDGIGAVVRVTSGGGTQWQTVHSGSSYCSASELALTFGLVRDSSASAIEIEWPSGTKQKLTNVAANQRMEIKER
jgi:hypothetical protein